MFRISKFHEQILSATDMSQALTFGKFEPKNNNKDSKKTMTEAKKISRNNLENLGEMGNKGRKMKNRFKIN